MLNRLIRQIAFKRACRKVAALHDEMLTNARWARTDIRLHGCVLDCHASQISALNAEKAAIAAKWNADVETMRLAGI